MLADIKNHRFDPLLHRYYDKRWHTRRVELEEIVLPRQEVETKILKVDGMLTESLCTSGCSRSSSSSSSSSSSWMRRQLGAVAVQIFPGIQQPAAHGVI